MGTTCYAMVRGSSMRVTDLTSVGAVPDPFKFATSKSVSKITINEITESGGNELLRNDDDEPRLHLVTNETTIRFDTDIDFLRCDPAILSLVSGVPVVVNATGDIVGFDATTRLKAKSFALEVWSRLSGVVCVPGSPRPYGYTLFPFLKGGTLSGFTFANGLVSFSLRGARTQRGPKWGYGPYDLEGQYQRLLQPVSRNTTWKSFVTTAQPPAQQDGTTSVAEDIIYGGDSSGSTPDILDGNVGPWSVGKN